MLEAGLGMTTLHRRMAAFLALLMLLAPLSFAAPSRYFCHAMARVVDACCCPRGQVQLHVDAAPGRETRAETPDCCERLIAGSPLASPGTRENATPTPDSTLTATLPSSAPVTLPAGEMLAPAALAALPPPRARPRLFLEHCALLI
jgi:hypothetical protein